MNNTIHHWRYFFYERQKWRKILSHVLTDIPQKPLSKAKITIEKHSIREMDYDNLVGSMKILIDIIKKSGYFIDDSPKYLEREYLWFKAKKEELKIIIKIKELE